MSKEIAPSFQKAGEMIIAHKKTTTFFKDIKAIVKLPVLLANVLPVFTGFWLALHFTNASFSANLTDFLLTMLGSAFVMAGALVLNNWYDVDIDTVMARTQHRPTVTGNFSLKVVLGMGISFTSLGFILLLFTTIEATLYAFVGWFTYVFLYTMWSKRRFAMNTIIGSISGAVSPLIGWTAIQPELNNVAIILFLILFVFQMPHTFAIAIKKFDEYKAAGVAMLPVVRGIKNTKVQMLLYIICLLPLPFFLGQLGVIFIILATTCNIGWIILSVRGFFTKDDLKWAHVNFLYSVNYITLLFLLMVIFTLPIFN